MFARQYLVGTLTSLVILSSAPPALSDTSCQEFIKISSHIDDLLPALQVVDGEASAIMECPQFAAADFNGDARMDYAIVLTEKIAPRQYENGSNWFSAYIVVLLSSKLPYADYQAVVLLGHTSRPDRYKLEVVKHSKRALLKVVNATYSETTYEWKPRGFSVKQHLAD